MTTSVKQRFGRISVLVFLLTIVPPLFYVAQIGRWSLDLDEIYTLHDSSEPLSAIIRYDKPLYYLLCHGTLQTHLLPEVAIRLPGAIAAGLIAPCFYWIGRRTKSPHEAIIASVIVAVHPWIYQQSQFGRFYALMLLFSSIAVLSLYRWLVDRRPTWIVVYFGSSVLAAMTHATAAALFPAGAIGVFAYFWIENRPETISFLRQRRRSLTTAVVLLTTVASFAMRKPFIAWMTAQHGQYGNYTTGSLTLGFLAFTGLQLWALGVLPLFKRKEQWTGDDAFLIGMMVTMVVPFIFLAQFGGGVAPRYLLASTPLLFLLAARHWGLIHSQLPSARYQIAFAAVALSATIPTFASTMKDGNHCDYRSAAKYVDSLHFDNPVIVASAHKLLGHYLADDFDLRELRMLDDLTETPCADSSGVAGILHAVVEEAESSGRPLILVSREDRRIRPPNVQSWFNSRFAILARFEKPRFDHRRNEMVVYEYRPR